MCVIYNTVMQIKTASTKYSKQNKTYLSQTDDYGICFWLPSRRADKIRKTNTLFKKNIALNLNHLHNVRTVKLLAYNKNILFNVNAKKTIP